MGSNRKDSSNSNNKQASSPVDHYRKSIGRHQETLLSDSNIKKRLNMRKNEDSI